MAFPPGMLFTLQDTLVSVAPVTVALKAFGAPRSTDAEAGVTLMLMEEGVVGVGIGGVGTTELAIPPPHAAAYTAVARKNRTRGPREGGCMSALESVTTSSEGGRMDWRNAGEVPAKAATVEQKALFAEMSWETR